MNKHLEIDKLKIDLGFNVEKVQNKIIALIDACRLYGQTQVQVVSNDGGVSVIGSHGSFYFSPFKRITFHNNNKHYNFIFHCNADLTFKSALLSASNIPEDNFAPSFQDCVTEQEFLDGLDVMIEFLT